MIDMNKEIIFRDGVTLDGLPFDDYLKARQLEIIDFGYSYGLTLSKFFWNEEGVFLEWRGKKKAVKAWYIDYSTRFTSESDEKRRRTIEIIMNK